MMGLVYHVAGDNRRDGNHLVVDSHKCAAPRRLGNVKLEDRCVLDEGDRSTSLQ